GCVPRRRRKPPHASAHKPLLARPAIAGNRDFDVLQREALNEPREEGLGRPRDPSNEDPQPPLQVLVLGRPRPDARRCHAHSPLLSSVATLRHVENVSTIGTVAPRFRLRSAVPHATTFAPHRRFEARDIYWPRTSNNTSVLHRFFGD